jgi:hypothetical protein
MKTKVNMSQYLYWFFIIHTVICEEFIMINVVHNW